ncbi:MAG: hypothetical protein L0Z55_13175 [Planctomycetes bacterium]|nr:hypothetical protein [Planctomycetota bacterium]
MTRARKRAAAVLAALALSSVLCLRAVHLRRERGAIARDVAALRAHFLEAASASAVSPPGPRAAASVHAPEPAPRSKKERRTIRDAAPLPAPTPVRDDLALALVAPLEPVAPAELVEFPIAERRVPRILGILGVDGVHRVLVESADGLRDWLGEGDEQGGWEVLHIGEVDAILYAREAPARSARWLAPKRAADE